jgi:hypothetical protein
MANVTNQLVAQPYRFITHVWLSNGVPAPHVGPYQVYIDGSGVSCTINPWNNVNQGAFMNMYILRWGGGITTVGTIGSGADFFFTGPFTGCTFSIDKNWSRPTITHSNANHIGWNDPYVGGGTRMSPRDTLAKRNYMTNQARIAQHGNSSMFNMRVLANEFLTGLVSTVSGGGYMPRQNFFYEPPNITVHHSIAQDGSNDTFNLIGLRGYLFWTFYKQYYDVNTGGVSRLETVNTWL